MAKCAPQKLNRSGNSHAGDTIRVITHGFFGAEKLSALERVIFSALYSFAQKGATADFTYSEIARRYHISYATVARTIPKKALEHCFERGDKPHSYKLKEMLPPPDRYFILLDWLRFAVFSPDGVPSDLTNDQIEVLSYIIHQNNHLANWTSTQASIARSLEIAPSTVSTAVALFEKAGILTVKCTDPARSRCANHLDRAAFDLNYDELNKIRDATLGRLKALSREIRSANARSDRERFYAEHQKLAHAHEQRVRAQLGADLQTIERQIGLLEQKIAKEQIRKRYNTIQQLLQERQALKKEMKEFLAAHGFTEADLEPRYICPLCNDTGFDLKTNKPCTCYTPPGGRR